MAFFNLFAENKQVANRQPSLGALGTPSPWRRLQQGGLGLLLVLASAALPAAAQNIAFTKDRFANDKDGLREATRELKEGEGEYANDPPRYAQALPHFLKAQLFNPNNAVLNVRIGDCYLNSTTKTAALPYLQKAATLDATADARTHYLLARALHLNAKWDEAIAEYQQAKPVGTTSRRSAAPAVTADDLARRIRECHNGQQLMAKPVRVFIDNAGPELNSPASDYGPVVSADEATILITSRRAGSTGAKQDPEGNGFFEDIYQATWQGTTWSPAANLGTVVNTEEHDATVGLAPDGQRMLVYKDTNGGDLLEANLKGSAWGKPSELGARINTRYHETSASYSPDGRFLYFVSNRPESGKGSSDIYKVELESRTPPVNLGATINTPYGEEGVFVQPDGKTMFFSSEGHNSMGGYDIFKSVFENGQWSEPENLGWPINTPDDDIFFVTSASGRHGYYSSDRVGGLGAKDIYRITFLGPEKQPILSEEDQLLASRVAPVKQDMLAPAVTVATAQVTILKGTVTDNGTKLPIEANIDLLDNTSGLTIATFRSNATSGKYLVSLPSGTNYGIVVRQDGYLFHSENFNVPAGAAYAEVVKDIPLKRLEVGAVIVLKNIFFDTGKATLRKESTAELGRLQKLLVETPTLRLEMSGHTDNVGEAAQNRNLSQRRAQAVVTYLTQHGIVAARLTAAGYGEARPVAPNTTRTGRQLNRRTEFKVTAK